MVFIGEQKESAGDIPERVRGWKLDTKPENVIWKAGARKPDDERALRSLGKLVLGDKVIQIVLNPDENGAPGENSGVLRIAEVDKKLWVVACDGATGIKPKAMEISDKVEASPYGLTLHLGASEDRDFQFAGDEVSRRHADIQIMAEPGRYTVKVRENSLNGTSVSRMPIPETREKSFAGVMSGAEAGDMAYKLRKEVEKWGETRKVPSDVVLAVPVEVGKIYEVDAGGGRFRIGRTKNGVVMTRPEPGSAMISMDNGVIRDNNEKGYNYRFGRASESSIKLTGDRVSRQHGSIGFKWEDGGPVMSIRDGADGRSSANGTRLRTADIK